MHQRTRIRAGFVAAAIAVTAVTACSSEGTTVTAGEEPSPPLDAATAAAVVEAGELGVGDLEGTSEDGWEVSDYEEDGEDVAECLDLVGAEGDPGVLATGRSDVLQSDDDRGPTLVFVTAQSVTVVHESAEAAAAALARLAPDALAACIAESTDVNVVDGEEGDTVRPVEPSGVDVERSDAVDAGDEAVSYLVTYDQEFGDGDDNTSAVEVHGVRVGPAVEVIFTTRDGEDQEDDVVEGPTPGLTDTVATVVARVTDAVG
jgi:hypothetical protein